MPRLTPEQLEQASRDAEEWLDNLDLDTVTVDYVDDLRAIATANDRLVAARRDLKDGIAAARKNDRSWAAIGRALGVSAQAAQQKYAPTKKKAPAKRKAAKRATAKRLPAKTTQKALKSLAKKSTVKREPALH